MNHAAYILSAYLLIVSAVAVGVTVFDKRAAKRASRRVPERVLLWIAVLGGSVAMLLTMSLIRHKTKHPKFMIGIPAIIISEYVIFLVVYNHFR